VPDYLGTELAFAAEFQVGGACMGTPCDRSAGRASKGPQGAWDLRACRSSSSAFHLCAQSYSLTGQVAAMYAANRLWQEALDGYNALVRNRQASQGARCARTSGQVNGCMGNATQPE
jgi:hypothetical protein